MANPVHRFFRRVQRAKEFPDEPWRWREDWSAGAVAYSDLQRAIPFVTVGLLVLLVSGVPLWVKRDTFADGGASMLAITLAFPAIGVAALAWSGLPFLRWRKYGRTTAVLKTNPGVVGGWLHTEIRTGFCPGPGDGLVASLRCVYRSGADVGEGGGSKHTVWEVDQTIDPSDVHVGSDSRATIPVSFYVPPECKESSRNLVGVGRDMPVGYSWKLALKGTGRASSYTAEFVVPVFKTGTTVEKVAAEAEERFGDAIEPEDAPGGLKRAGIKQIAENGLEITTAPRRHLFAVILGSCFMLASAWWLIMLIQQRGVIFVPNVIALALTAGLALATGWLLIGVRRVVVDPNRVLLELRVGRPIYTKQLPMDAVSEVVYRMKDIMNGQERWEVLLRAPEQRLVVSGGLEKAEAKSLAERIRHHVRDNGSREIEIVEDTED